MAQGRTTLGNHTMVPVNSFSNDVSKYVREVKKLSAQAVKDAAYVQDYVGKTSPDNSELINKENFDPVLNILKDLKEQSFFTERDRAVAKSLIYKLSNDESEKISADAKSLQDNISQFKPGLPVIDSFIDTVGSIVQNISDYIQAKGNAMSGMDLSSALIARAGKK